MNRFGPRRSGRGLLDQSPQRVLQQPRHLAVRPAGHDPQPTDDYRGSRPPGGRSIAVATVDTASPQSTEAQRRNWRNWQAVDTRPGTCGVANEQLPIPRPAVQRHRQGRCADGRGCNKRCSRGPSWEVLMPGDQESSRHPCLPRPCPDGEPLDPGRIGSVGGFLATTFTSLPARGDRRAGHRAATLRQASKLRQAPLGCALACDENVDAVRAKAKRAAAKGKPHR
jgi:hypothetical protein